MIFVIETIDVIEGPPDTVRPERTMSGPYPMSTRRCRWRRSCGRHTATPSSIFCTSRPGSRPRGGVAMIGIESEIEVFRARCAALGRRRCTTRAARTARRRWQASAREGRTGSSSRLSKFGFMVLTQARLGPLR
jgi:hypothetical protein